MGVLSSCNSSLSKVSLKKIYLSSESSAKEHSLRNPSAIAENAERMPSGIVRTGLVMDADRKAGITALADKTEENIALRSAKRTVDDNGVTVILKEENVIYLTIELDNTEDYYIMDFKLFCEEEDLEVVTRSSKRTVKAGSKMTFRWDEAIITNGNQSATFEVHLSKSDVSPDKIKISDMFYSDKGDGSNRKAVNLNNKEIITVYKVDQFLETVERRNYFDAFYFRLNAAENCTVKGVYVDDTSFKPDENGEYAVPGGHLRIEYDYAIDGGPVYHGALEENIELLKLEYAGDPNVREGIYISYTVEPRHYFTIDVYMKVTGTDADIFYIEEYRDVYIGKNTNVHPICGEMIDYWFQVPANVYSIHVNIAGSGFTLEEIAEIINVTIVDYGM